MGQLSSKPKPGPVCRRGVPGGHPGEWACGRVGEGTQVEGKAVRGAALS